MLPRRASKTQGCARFGARIKYLGNLDKINKQEQDTHSDTCIQLTQFPDGKEGDGTARWKGQLKQYC